MRQQEQQTDQTTVRSEPVPVPSPDDRHRPVDRAGRTGVPEDAVDDRGTYDDPTADRSHPETRADGVTGADSGTRGGRAEFHDPGPVPTAFGATTVGGAVAASALASPVPADEPDPREERTARPGDGAVGERGVGRRADPTALLHGHHRDQRTDEAEPADRGSADVSATRRDHAAGRTGATPDRAGDGRSATAGRDVSGAAAGVAATGSTGAGTPGAGYGSPAPTMVDPDTAPVSAVPTDSLTAAGTTGSSALAEPATLLDPATAQGFRDRWREVQLRFVDDPKAAAGQAEGLVEEAIRALDAALAAQKDRIGSWHEDSATDTEQLRQAVRRYRDFLDRVLGR